MIYAQIEDEDCTAVSFQTPALVVREGPIVDRLGKMKTSKFKYIINN